MENPTPTRPDYNSLALESRRKVLELVYNAQTSHIGSLMGAADLFAVVFSHIDLDKDKFVLSAGWKAALLYFHLWKLGRITLEELDSYCMEGSKFIGLAEPIHPDIPFAGGSMGYGLPAGVGFALAKKLKGEDGKVYVYMSDGELQCGTTWEAAMLASAHELDNLVVIVECNGLQAMGPVKDVMGDNYFPGVPFYRRVVDGHNYDEINRALENEGNTGIEPLVILAHTTKGKGVDFMEGNNLYHYKAPSDEEYEKALIQLHG